MSSMMKHWREGGGMGEGVMEKEGREKEGREMEKEMKMERRKYENKIIVTIIILLCN